MEWVETTGRTVEEAKELALDQLGVVADDADFEVLAEPKQGLFGRLRGEARVRARVRPTPARPKQDRRRGKRGDSNGDRAAAAPPAAPTASPAVETAPAAAEDTSTADEAPDAADAADGDVQPTSRGGRRGGRGGRGGRRREPAPEDDTSSDPENPEGTVMTNEQAEATDPADVEAVREAALAFVGGLTSGFGFDGAAVDAAVEGNEIEVRVTGESLGLLIGPGGRTLLAIQDLARVAAQRRLGDHDTRLRVDVAGYREKRREALERFAATVAAQVKETGIARSLDPMPSADRKVLHDALGEIDGVSSRSEGEDPNRRIVVSPA